MKKQERIEYINRVWSRFRFAKNHGNVGNWWYPKENRIAYDVKMRSYGDVETLTSNLSDLQKDYYEGTEYLQQDIYSEQEYTCEMLIDNLVDNYDLVTSAGFAGRSGGWIEVDFEVGFEEVDNTFYDSEISESYKMAKELEEEEQLVEKEIARQHKAYNYYVDSDNYYTDLREGLMTDEDIKQSYKDQAESLLSKIA